MVSRWRFSAVRLGRAGACVGLVLGAVLLSACGYISDVVYLREKVELQDQTIRRLRAELRQLQEYYNQLYEQKVKDNERFAKEIKLRNERIRQLQTMRSDRERELEKLERETRMRLDRVIKENSQLRADLRKLSESSRAEIASLKKQIADLKATNSSLEKQLASARSEADSFRSRAEKAESSLADARKQIDSLKSDSAKLQERLKQYEQTVAKLRQQVAEASKSESQLAQLRKQLRARTDEVERLKGQLASLRGSGKVADPKLAKAREDLARILAPQIKQKQAEVIAQPDRVIVRLQSDALFDPATVLLSEPAKAYLREIAGVLKDFAGYQLRVEGHTDSQPVRRMPFPDNLALSSQRADNVLRFLMESVELPKDMQIRSVGCSYWMPIAGNDTPEGRRRNRRVEIILMHKE